MTSEYASAILQMPLFSGFTPVGAQRLLDLGKVKEHARGDQLYREGDFADCALLVLRGRLRVYVERGGIELVVSDFGPGSILGDIAVLCGTPRATSARALEPSAILHWTAQEFRSLLLGDVFLSQRILSTSLRFLIEHEKSLIDALTCENHG
jgi:CRP-like cAMP-binding protein